jgi:hypothetical protein
MRSSISWPFSSVLGTWWFLMEHTAVKRQVSLSDPVFKVTKSKRMSETNATREESITHIRDFDREH